VRRLAGRPAAPGAVVGPCFVLSAVPHDGGTGAGTDRVPGSAKEETTLLGAALDAAAAELEALADRLRARVGDDEAAILLAQAGFARDPELRAEAARRIAGGARADDAVRAALSAFVDLLLTSGSELLAERVTDLEDVGARIVAHIRGVPSGIALPSVPSVLVAHDLYPSQTAAVPADLLLAMVTESGSATSHAAILARALGVPAVVGCQGLLAAVAEAAADGAGDALLTAVDGGSGEVVIDPDVTTRMEVERRREALARRRELLSGLRELEGTTSDGVRIELAANIGASADLDAAVAVGAEGSGLVRTELLFEGRTSAPDVDEQIAFYRRAAAAFPGRRVVLRTMDIGADKPLPFVMRPVEPNPALGLRGLRLHLERTDLFETQLEAIVQVALEQTQQMNGARIAVMFPMVSHVTELERALGLLDTVLERHGAVRAGADGPAVLEVGVMVEVPSAALDADAFAERVAFLSLGTNDLVQYVYAADRLNADVAGLGDLCEPAMLRLVRAVVAAAGRHGCWVGVCGESAADPIAALALVGLGVRELSMVAPAIPEIKDLLRTRTLPACRDAIEEALERCDSAAQVRAELARLLDVTA